MSSGIPLATILREPAIYSRVQDEIAESTLEIDAFEQLRSLADRNTAVENYIWERDAEDVEIFCHRGAEVREATFWVSGVVARHSTMPYTSFPALTRKDKDAIVPPGYQYVALMGPEIPEFVDAVRAVDNIYVMGRLRLSEGRLKPLTTVEIDGTPALVASTAIGTPRDRMLQGDEPLRLNEEEDPKGIAQQWLAQRNMVHLPDNRVDVYMASRKDKAGEYDFNVDQYAGAALRTGQVVLCEVGFRIVPAGPYSVMRTDLKTLAIINANVTKDLAFARIDAENQAGVGKNIISISSAGPSGLTIKEKAKVKRAPRQRRNTIKDQTMDDLPFA